MTVRRLNHAVLYVRDVERSAAFYTEVFGFEVAQRIPGRAAFLRAAGTRNDHDLGLFQVGEGAPSPAPGSTGLYHLAWEVGTLGELAEMARKLQGRGSLVGASDHTVSKSLYAKDPDGIEFEVSWLVPAHLLDDATLEARKQIRPLDLSRELERYGAQTLGGVGVSSKAPA
jgi:catechol-2,3-dioxygenase